jgi:RNA polymerase sigma-70 factor, ECF subfamily
MTASHYPAPFRASSTRQSGAPAPGSDVAWQDTSAVFERRAVDSNRPPPGSTAVEASSGPVPGYDDIGQLFAEHRAYVARIGRRILGATSELDDLIQDVFLATVKDIHKLKDPARLRAWLGTVTTRMAKRRRFRRSAYPIFSHDDLDDVVDLATEEGPGPESAADLSGNIEKVLSLPDELRVPWLLKHVEGRTLEDVARQCDCSLSTAQRRIQSVSDRIMRRR